MTTKLKAPTSKTPKRGTRYYCLTSTIGKGYSSYLWRGDGVDLRALANGIWLNEEDI